MGISTFMAVEEASAKTAVPYQQSIIRRGLTSTAQSASGYEMVGTKKRGISASKKAEILESVKSAAKASSAPTAS